MPISDGEPYCEHHEMSIIYPHVYVFCSSYLDPQPDNGDWLDQELNREELQANMMYLWLGGHEVKFFHVPLAPIAEYKDWTAEKYSEELGNLADKYRNA
jgi:hypothetical protein